MPKSAASGDKASTETYSLSSILKKEKTGHKADIFDEDEKQQLESGIFTKNGKPYIKCFVSEVERALKPEEIVRQLFVRRLHHRYGYPKERLAVEKPVYFGEAVHEKRADIVVFHKNSEELYMVVETKKPKRKDGEEQLKSYCNAEGSPIGIWTNGQQIEVWHRERPNNFLHIPELPRVDETLEQVISEPWTIDKLTKENKLLTERKSLRDIIETLEDLVLANSGADSFEEVFKLIYAKLYDEWAAANIKARNRKIMFRIYGESATELTEKINGLFHEAMAKWKGVFGELEKIELTPTHLMTCASFLQDIKLFNSNLYVIDEAFEYLVTQVAKGAKGQFFTPRHVIDMCVKMLNPTEKEYVLDSAAGSCGFTVHTIFHIAGQQFTNQKLPAFATEFAQNNVYGIDFDARAVKVAKALNLIAGDGKTHVYKANSLDSSSWDSEVVGALKPFLKRFPEDREEDDYNQKNLKYFTFDAVLTNPPFAGEISERHLLKEYVIAEKDGRLQSSVERDTLFIERNLNFLKDGGRMAIVLPQGILNNAHEKYIRDFITKRARLLAVVSLGDTTFRPHTSTKTSILFVQKWDQELCPRRKDYPIFFAVSEKSGKDSSGNYVFLKDESGEVMLDQHGHPRVNHDLDQVADEFIKFGKAQGFSFLK
jgi:type I restriction enzyme M protein